MGEISRTYCKDGMNQRRTVLVAVGLVLSGTLTTALWTTVQTTSATDRMNRPVAEDIHTLSEQNLYLTWTVSSAPNGQSRIRGFIYNNSDDRVNDLQLRIIELDPSNRILSNGVRTFEESVPARDRVAFEVQVPSHGSSSYQLMIDTFTQNLADGVRAVVGSGVAPRRAGGGRSHGHRRAAHARAATHGIPSELRRDRRTISSRWARCARAWPFDTTSVSPATQDTRPRKRIS